MNSEVLIVAGPANVTDKIDAQRVPDVASAISRLGQSRYACVVLFCDDQDFSQIEILLQALNAKTPPPKLVLVGHKPNDGTKARWLELHIPFRWLNQAEPKGLAQVIREALDRRQTTLSKAHKRLLSANQQIETLHAATLAVHKARSLGELESSLAQALRQYLGVGAVRIRFQAQSALSQSAAPGTHHQPLRLGVHHFGELVLVRDDQKAFRESELNLLRQIGEATALAVDRLTKLEQAEVLKQQWQATFDSIVEPLCLTDSQYRILRTNRTFATILGLEFRELINRNCFEIFFDKSHVPEFFALGRAFKVRRHRWDGRQSRSFEISVQPLNFESFDGEVILVLFRDITAREQMERQVLESSKMAELGLIGSSIAHELNNPLGGMLSFIQLIRMELKGSEPFHQDVLEMENAAGRCRDIVQQLLGFARKSDTSDRRQTDLREILDQAVRISALQTRSQGIAVEVNSPSQALPMTAQVNQLTQALCNLIQNAAEAILERRRQDARAPAQITITLKTSGRDYELEIRDTGVGISPEVQSKIFNPLFSTKGSRANSGLGLTVAYRIVTEHLGQLEIVSQAGVGTTAKISFAQPDLSTESQVFDGKI